MALNPVIAVDCETHGISELMYGSRMDLGTQDLGSCYLGRRQSSRKC